MNAGVKVLRSLSLASLFVGLVVAAGPARAVENPGSCTNDIDCVATPACGGDLCDWDQGLKCKPASATNKGWCMADTDCKCHGAGATCTSAFHCTVTTPAATGTAGTGGGTAGTTGAAGTGTTGAAGTGTTGAAGTTGTSSSSGGCAVAASSTGGVGVLVGLALVLGGVVRRRRRA